MKDRNPDMITHTLNMLNKKYRLDVKIEKVSDSKILPQINKHMLTIRFNIRLLPLFVLYKMGNADLVIKYFCRINTWHIACTKKQNIG